MTDFLGGEEVWRQLSTMLQCQGMTGEEARLVLSNSEFQAKIAGLAMAARPGAKSAASPTVALLIPDGWQIMTDVNARFCPDQRQVEFLLTHRNPDEQITWKTIQVRASDSGGDCGLADVDFLLERPYLITDVLAGGRDGYEGCILFPGTVLRDSSGNECIPKVSLTRGNNPSLSYQRLNQGVPPVKSLFVRLKVPAVMRSREPPTYWEGN